MSIEKLIEFSKNGEKNTDKLELIKGFPSKLQPARQWFNWIFNNLTLKINEVIESLNNSEKASDDGVGLVSICPYQSIPKTHLACTGGLHKIVDYPKLFAKIGNMYGGDGVNTFATPDYRGVFLRGLDEGKNLDPNRELGTYQEDELKSHMHDYLQVRGGGAGQTSGGSSNYNTTVETSQTGGDETRPKNIAVIYVIKAM